MKPPMSKSKLDKYPFLNPDKEPLTVEKLLTYPGCEHYSLEEADAIVASIKSFTVILLEFHRNKPICIDNQLIVNLNGEAKSPKVIPLHPKNRAA